MSIYDDNDNEDDDIDLNPHKPKLPPVPPSPEGFVWTGFYPNMELVSYKELGERFKKIMERRAKKDTVSLEEDK